MINFQPSEEQDLLRQTLAGFAREVIRPQAREADEKESVPAPVIKKAGNSDSSRMPSPRHSEDSGALARQ